MELNEIGAWKTIVELDTDYWDELSKKIDHAYENSVVYPPRKFLFNALQKTPPEKVKVVIIGQDPYHEPGQAHGLSFSVEDGIAIPKSLANIYKELELDLEITPAKSGNLIRWAKQGVLLLNSVLTVEAHKAGSHRKIGWEYVTDQLITATNQLKQPIVFILWGNFAIKKQELIQSEYPRLCLSSVHPSPLSAYRGFFGSKPFSKANEFLIRNGSKPIMW